jgi:23S rRNA (uracil1939-C5)-methyltransferase
VTAIASFFSARGVAETVTISALGHGGDGIAETNDGRLFVPFTLPGETAEIERAGTRGRVNRILDKSRDRVTPVCRHFGVCGGCTLQHMERSAYLAWKHDVVADAFDKRGITIDIAPVVPIAEHSRRRAVFSAVRAAKGIVLGFHRRGATEIVAVEECPVLAPSIVSALPTLRRIAGLTLRAGRQTRIVVTAADNGLDIAVENAGRIGRAELEALGSLGTDMSLARLTVDGNEIFLNRRPEIVADGLTLLPVPGGFLQAVKSAETALARAIIDHVGDANPVADLFAGIGTFALRLARRASVTAFEGSADLVSAIETASHRSPGLKPVTAQKRDLFRNPLAPIELDAFGAVVFDPPAAGAKAQADAIAASRVPKVAAVSCNPATLARDARILIDGGYQLSRVLPVDQFLYSAEIEVVATFER